MPLPKLLRRFPFDRLPRCVGKFLHDVRKALLARPTQDGMDDAVTLLGIGSAAIDVVKEAP